MPKTGRPPVIGAEHYPLLTRLAHARPYSSQAELTGRASLSKCTTGSVPNGESVWIVMNGREPLYWIPNQRVAPPKALKAVTTLEKGKRT